MSSPKDALLEPLTGDSESGQPPKSGPATAPASVREKQQPGFPAPVVSGDFAYCTLAHRADGKPCGERIRLAHPVLGYTDWQPLLDHVRSDAHRMELMTALHYSMAAGWLHQPRPKARQ